MTMYAHALITVISRQEMTFEVDEELPEGFALWTPEQKYEWLDENAYDQYLESSESDGIQSIDAVFYDE